MTLLIGELIYIYMYMERERERDRESQLEMSKILNVDPKEEKSRLRHETCMLFSSYVPTDRARIV